MRGQNEDGEEKKGGEEEERSLREDEERKGEIKEIKGMEWNRMREEKWK